jgi:hypothetical protein
VVSIASAGLVLRDINDVTVALQSTGAARLQAAAGLAASGSVASGQLAAGQSVSLGALSVTGNLAVEAGLDIGQSGALQVGGATALQAGGDIDLSLGNLMAGTVTAQAELIALQARGDLLFGSLVADESIKVVSTGGSITLQSEPKAPVVEVGAATTVALEGQRQLGAQTVTLRAGQGLVRGNEALTLQASTVTVDSGAGQVWLQLTHGGPIDAQISAAGSLRVTHEGDLRFAAGSALRSSGADVAVQAARDVWTSGLSLSADSASIEAGRAIRADAQLDAAPLVIDGSVHLQAQAGIGGFDFERVLIEQSGGAARVSASNGASGDVVIAGVQGLTLAPQSVQSDANDGWVVLLGGRGAVVEQGDLIVRPNLVRATGINWMAREQIDTSLLLTAVLKSGAMQELAQASPLERMNRLLAEGFGQSDAASEPALESAPKVLKTQSSVSVGAPREINAQTVSVMAVPKTTSQLLEMAMTLTQQGGNPSMGDAESLGAWVARTSPSESSREPMRDSSREPNVQPAVQPAVQPLNSAPAQQPADAAPAAPATAPTTPSSESPAGNPATPAPQGSQPAPGAASEPKSSQTPADAQSPTSDVRWLLPQDELQQWLPTGPQQAEPASAQSGVFSGLKGAAVKLSQWLGWSTARADAAPKEESKPESAASAPDDGRST